MRTRTATDSCARRRASRTCTRRSSPGCTRIPPSTSRSRSRPSTTRWSWSATSRCIRCAFRQRNVSMPSTEQSGSDVEVGDTFWTWTTMGASCGRSLCRSVSQGSRSGRDPCGRPEGQGDAGSSGTHPGWLCSAGDIVVGDKVMTIGPAASLPKPVAGVRNLGRGERPRADPCRRQQTLHRVQLRVFAISDLLVNGVQTHNCEPHLVRSPGRARRLHPGRGRSHYRAVEDRPPGRRLRQATAGAGASDHPDRRRARSTSWRRVVRS